MVGTYDVENVIDDFVLVCILVGNDFLPHSPTLDIAEGAMDTIFETYRNLLMSEGGYLTSNGRVNLEKLEAFASKLGEGELQTLLQRAEVRAGFLSLGDGP